ncbi:hypothetical protein D3227_21715 [Mesorhizobium waimense]|uniref:Uncharacterized protein n=1 Tax=Mesorhizobium waimense TaxID=1300307 RepID=A0A3A5KH79_9HYPH|nr:hypothetical protein [Mesorhizobium waimense]RJT35255.1 hypothetical protein D3227_21715 [Mesorhizobium waimense]
MAVEQDDDDQDLDEDQRREKAEQKEYDEMVAASDKVLNDWMAAHPEDARQAVIDSYIEGGEIDAATAGVQHVEVQIIEASFTKHIERSILSPLGLTMAQWQEHMDEAELPAFRRAVVKGDWQALIDHARAAAKMRLDLGI